MNGWGPALEAWVAVLRSQGLAESTVGKRAQLVRAFARDAGAADPWGVVHDDLAAWIDEHAGTSAAASVRRAALRSFYRWALEAGHVEVSPARFLDPVNCARPTRRRVVRPVGARGPLPAWTPRGWQAALDGWEQHRALHGTALTTLSTWTGMLRRLARDFPHRDPYTLELEDLAAWIAGHESWSNETRRSAQAALRSFYRWALEAGHVEASPAERLPLVRSRPPLPRPATEDAVHFAVLTATPRERVMVRLAAEIGLRRAEVAVVHSRDVQRVGDGWSLIVHGKGGRERVMPLPDELAGELRDLPPGFAFPGGDGGHLSPRWVGRLVRRLLPDGVTMHALRHRFATRAYAMTRDVFVVQQLLGHARPETTRRYVEVSDDRTRAAVVDLARATTRSASPAL